MILILKESERELIVDVDEDEFIRKFPNHKFSYSPEKYRYLKYKNYMMIVDIKMYEDIFNESSFNRIITTKNNFMSVNNYFRIKVYNTLFDYDKIINIEKRQYEYLIVFIDDVNNKGIDITLNRELIPRQLLRDKNYFLDLFLQTLFIVNMKASKINLNEKHMSFFIEKKEKKIVF